MTLNTFAMGLLIKRDTFVPRAGLPCARCLSLIYPCP